MTFSTAALFSQNLIKFIEFYSELSQLDPDNLKQGELKSEVRKSVVMVRLPIHATKLLLDVLLS